MCVRDSIFTPDYSYNYNRDTVTHVDFNPTIFKRRPYVETKYNMRWDTNSEYCIAEWIN